jgi:hypothetical protein
MSIRPTAIIAATGPATFHEDGLTTTYQATGDHARGRGAGPQRLNPRYDSGGHLHPDDAGYRAIAASIDPGDL